MELDSRIKEGKRPLTCLDVEQAREFVGKECIFSDNYENYRNIRKYDMDNDNEYTGILSMADQTNCGDFVFKNTKNKYRYRLILPREWVEQPTTPEFVPYTLDTWEQEFKTGDVVFFKGKEDTGKENNYYKCMYLGHLENENNRILVILGCWLFAFDALIDLYEIYRNGTWEPFGRKVETIDLNVIKNEG